MDSVKRIVIIGGGFAGLHLARKLNGSPYHVLLIDKLNHHQFQPLFYQVALAFLEPSSISFPFRKIFQGSENIEYLYGEVLRILPESNQIETTRGIIGYDHLVIASGCKTNYFGNTDLQRYAFSMKSTEESLVIRNYILEMFEIMCTMPEPIPEEFWKIVIVGAGPTGVELAGAFAEMKRHILPKDYPQKDFSRLKIILLEGSPYTLPTMSDASRLASRRYLEELGVIVRTGILVSGYDGTRVLLNNGEFIPSRYLIWAAGVTGNVISGLQPECVVHNNRYRTDRFNRIIGYENIYALGDVAYMETPKYPKGHPQVANVAINQAKNLGRNFLASLKQKPWKPYEYRDLGSMATIGKHKAVVDLPFIRFQGYLAWFIWMFLHLMLILSVRNKLIILINWAWSYVTSDSSLRLIFRFPRRTADSAS